MDAVTSQDVDGSGERCGDRWDEDGEAAVLELLDDERRHERLLDLHECRLPNVLSAFPRDLLRETSKQRVSRNSLENRRLHPLAERFAQARTDGDPNQEAHRQDQDERQDILGGQPGREQHRERPNQGCPRTARP